MRKEPHDGGAFTPRLVRDVFRDEAALVQVAGDAFLVRLHARSGWNC